jgi:uncharacterized protein YicC (UPF0701 family)
MSLTDKLRGATRQQVDEFAPPAQREQMKLQALEKELAQAAPVQRTIVGSSTDMTKVSGLLRNSVTLAHEDTCAALDRVLADASRMMDRLNMAVHDHKQRLRDDGQRIAYQLEAALQALTHAVSWVEEHSPRLNDPQVQEGTQVTDSKLLLDKPTATPEPAPPVNKKPKKNGEPKGEGDATETSGT